MPKTIGHLKKDKRTKPQQKKAFLDKFKDVASVSKAAKLAKVARSNIYLWLDADQSFKDDFKEACKVAVAALEDEAIRRAHEGTLKPIFQGGKKVGAVREYSDTLLIFLLKGLAPEKYKDRSVHEMANKDGNPFLLETTHKVVFENYAK